MCKYAHIYIYITLHLPIFSSQCLMHNYSHSVSVRHIRPTLIVAECVS